MTLCAPACFALPRFSRLDCMVNGSYRMPYAVGASEPEPPSAHRRASQNAGKQFSFICLAGRLKSFARAFTGFVLCADTDRKIDSVVPCLEQRKNPGVTLDFSHFTIYAG